MTQVAVSDLLAEVAQIARECPQQTMVAAYVRAARRLCDKSRWLTFATSVTTSANVSAYALAVDPEHEIIGILGVAVSENDSDPTDADAADVAVYETLAEGNSGGWDANDSAGLPDTYQYLPPGMLLLHPAPRLAYGLRVMAVVQPAAGAQNLNDALVRDWGYALEAGALAYLLALPRTPWTDKAEARYQEGVFTAQMNHAASSAQRAYNAGGGTNDTGSSASLRTRMASI